MVLTEVKIDAGDHHDDRKLTNKNKNAHGKHFHYYAYLGSVAFAGSRGKRKLQHSK